MPPGSQTYYQRIPQAPGALERTRLLTQLATALEKKITLISAPPGYGKTTLASQFARGLPDHLVIWQIVTEQDKDIAWLYRRVLSALRDLTGHAANLPDPKGYTPAELAAFTADALRMDEPQELVYILDDAHHLVAAESAQVWLRRLVELLPTNCHLVIVTRDMPRLPYAELIARNEIAAVGAEELRFSADEAIRLAQQVMADPPPPERIRDLVQQLEGWPAGVMMAMRPLPADLERAMLGGQTGPEALFSALASTMLETQPPAFQDFLLASSTLAQMTPETCDRALGLAGSVRWLAEAQMRNLFLLKEPGGLVYHALFRDFLQARLKGLSPERFDSLHERAARFFEARREIDRALEHYLTAGLPEQAAALAERLAPSYDAQDRVETLFNWNNRLKAASVVAPHLSLICTRGLIDRYEYDAAEEELSRAETTFYQRKDAIGLGKIAVRRSVIDILRGSPQAAAARLESMIDILPDVENVRGRALGTLGLALLHLGEIARSVETLEEALPLYRADGDGAALSHVLQDMVIACYRQGQFDRAGEYLQEYVALRRDLGGAGTLAMALNNLGYYYHQRGDYRQAAETLQEGFAVVARVSDRRTESYLLWSMGDLQRDLGHFDRAAQIYQRALHLIGSGEPQLRLSVLLSLSILRRWQGSRDTAIAQAIEARDVAEQYGAVNEESVAAAALIAARAHFANARDLLDGFAPICETLQARDAQVELLSVYGMQARVELLAGHTQACLDLLSTAQKLAARIGSWQPLLVEVAHSPALESFARQNRNLFIPLLDAVDRLIEAGQVAADSTPLPVDYIDTQTFVLQVTTLGQEQIERDGRLLTPTDWRSVAAKEIFLYLLFNGPANREQLSLVFWPDSTSRRVRSNFHTTLYRARQAVGEGVIIYEDERYQINPNVGIWCDAFEMEAGCRLARLLPPRDARAEDLWRQAIDLYQGPFLPMVYTDWTVRRQRLHHDLYLEALLGAAECARTRRDYRETLRWLNQALEEEPLREDIHRAIMITYSLMGEKYLIAQQYEALRRQLRRELGTTPSEETSRLARTLLN